MRTTAAVRSCKLELEMFQPCDVLPHESLVHRRDRRAAEHEGGPTVEQPRVLAAESAAATELFLCFSSWPPASMKLSIARISASERTRQRGQPGLAQRRNQIVVSEIEHYGLLAMRAPAQTICRRPSQGTSRSEGEVDRIRARLPSHLGRRVSVLAPIAAAWFRMS